jgi:hypothetical protein
VAGVSNQRVELRLLLIVPVLLALLGMHAFVAAPPGETGHAATTAAVPSDGAAGIPAISDLTLPGHDPADVPGDHGARSDPEHALHLCLAILTSLGVLLLAAGLRLGGPMLGSLVAPVRSSLRRWSVARPPPMSRRLAQLCVMRS